MTTSALHRRTAGRMSSRKARLHVPRFGKAILFAIAVVLFLAVVIRLILDPIATRQTRHALDRLQGIRGEFERVHVTIFSPAYEITHLKLIQTPEHRGDEPMVYAEKVRAGLNWSQLVRGRLAAAVRIDQPKFVIVTGPEKKVPAPKKKAAPDLSAQLQDSLPFKLDRLELFGGEVLFRGRHQGEAGHDQELWVHGLELSAQNLTTRPGLAAGRATTLSAHGMVGKSGDLTIFVSADPLTSPLSFAGQASVVGLRAAEMYQFIAPTAKVQTPGGTIDVFIEFVSKNGALTGGVKPVLKHIEVRPMDDGVWDRLKSWLADKAVDVASDRVPGRDAVATTVPLKGRLTDPDIQLWPTVLGIIRNAFVQGLVSGFAHLPPPTAPEKEGVLTQVKKALTKSSGPPKAQPQGDHQ